MDSVDNSKTYLIIGASRGLGKALTLNILKQGHRVLALGKSQESLDQLKKETQEINPSRLVLKKADISHREEIIGVLSELIQNYNIDVALFNAGIKHDTSNYNNLSKTYDTFQTNLSGTIYCLEAILPEFIKKNRGQIAIISSLGRHHGMIHSNGYNASKAALSILTKSIQMDLCLIKGNKINLCLIEPGFIKTDMIAQKGFEGLLSVTSDQAAKIILKGIHKRKKYISFPTLMSFITKLTTMLPLFLQVKIFAKTKIR